MTLRNRSGVAVLVVAAFCAAPRAETAGQVYGAGLTEATKVSTLELLEHPQDYVGKLVRVEGRVADVCPHRGCWIDIVGEGAQRAVRFKVEDDVIVFPLEIKGRHVVAEGRFTAQELDHEATLRWEEHLAEERGEPFDPASVEGPRTYYRIEGSGAVVGAP